MTRETLWARMGTEVNVDTELEPIAAKSVHDIANILTRTQKPRAALKRTVEIMLEMIERADAEEAQYAHGEIANDQQSGSASAA